MLVSGLSALFFFSLTVTTTKQINTFGYDVFTWKKMGFQPYVSYSIVYILKK